jgi:hypothetical protein
MNLYPYSQHPLSWVFGDEVFLLLLSLELGVWKSIILSLEHSISGECSLTRNFPGIPFLGREYRPQGFYVLALTGY